MTISERLYNLRKDKKISQEELANILGVSRQTISKWETGESTPDFDKIVPLCEYFKITSDELLSGKKDIIEADKTENKKQFAKNLAISVALYISSIIMIIFFSTAFDLAELGVCLFFFINAIATGLIIYNGIVYGKKVEKENEKEKKKENMTIKLICEIIDIIGVIVYFLVSFTTGAWHITWIIFLIVALCQVIAKLIYGIKNEGSEGEENE